MFYIDKLDVFFFVHKILMYKIRVASWDKKFRQKKYIVKQWLFENKKFCFVEPIVQLFFRVKCNSLIQRYKKKIEIISFNKIYRPNSIDWTLNNLAKTFVTFQRNNCIASK